MMRPDLPVLLGRAIAPVLVVGVVAGCGDDGASTAAGGRGSGPASTSATGTTGSSTTNGTGAGGNAPADCAWAEGGFPTEACGACAVTACCDELLGCDADPVCGPLVRCYAGCDRDRACMEACALENPQSPALLAIGECMLGSCTDACPPSCEDAFPPPNARDRDACRACMQDECCDEIADEASPGFVAWVSCSQGCADALCLRDCELAHPDAPAIASATTRCIFGEACGESCLPTPEPGSVCGNFAYGEGTCTACAKDTCCAEQEACGFDVSCVNAFVCVAGCYDRPSCRACYEAWPPETMGRVLAVDGCTNAGCTEACTIDGCGYAKHLGSLACESCTRDACCAEQGACTDDAACAGLLVCTTVCDGDAACFADCEGRFPTAIAEHDALRSCQATSCGEECGP